MFDFLLLIRIDSLDIGGRCVSIIAVQEAVQLLDIGRHIIRIDHGRPDRIRDPVKGISR